MDSMISNVTTQLTARKPSANVLFRTLHSYLIIYRDSRPLRIVRIIHAKRDVKKLLGR